MQVMTYLVENEQAALVIPARLLARVHPHFREVQQLLAVQAADEARHMEVFTRRALLHGAEMGTSSVGGRASLGTPARRARLLPRLVPALGARRGQLPRPAGLPRRARPRPGHPPGHPAGARRRGPARRVRRGAPGAPGRSSTRPCAAGCGRPSSAATTPSPTPPASTPTCSTRWSCSPRASGRPTAIARGHRAVQRLQPAMDDGRRQRLARLGFPADEAAELSALHTRNFM